MRTVFAAFVAAICVLGLPALCAAAAEEAPPRATLAGTLYDPVTGLPAVGVPLVLVDPGEHRVVTDADGAFAFQDIEPGIYRYLFAFEPGSGEPAASILIGKNVDAIPGRRRTLDLQRELLPERPEDEELRFMGADFRDGREREHYKPIVLADPFGVEWPQQYVALPLRFGPRKCRHPSLRIIDGSTATEIPFQVTDIRYGTEDFITSCTVMFPASLERFERKMYAACSSWHPGFASPTYRTDLRVEENPDTGERVVANSLIALRLPPASGTGPTPAAECPAPILALRGADGVWFGRGQLVSEQPVTAFTCEEVETGPLFTEFRVTYHFDDAAYVLHVRMPARRDYVLLREEMRGEIDVTFRLSVSENFDPGSLLFTRGGSAVLARFPADFEKAETTLAVFRAWNPAGLRNSHPWYGVVASGNRRDAVGLVQVRGAAWEFDNRPAWADGSWLATSRDEEQVRLVATNAPDLRFEFPHRPGTRRFALVVFDRTRNWDPATLAAERPDPPRSHYLNRLHIRLSQLRLDRLPTMRLDRADLRERPRLLFNQKMFADLKAAFEREPDRFPDVLRDVFTGSRRHTSQVRAGILAGADAIHRAFLGTWDEKTLSGFHSAAADPARLEEALFYAALLYDAHVQSGLFSQREKEAILSMFALAAAQLEHPNYWPLWAHDAEAEARRGCTLSVLSLLLDKHPFSARRLLDARSRMLERLARAESTGGLPGNTGPLLRAMGLWAETAPLFDRIAGVAHVGESPFRWPAFVRALDRFAMLTCPPDRRFSGRRLLPTLGGSTAADARSLAVFGVAARELADRGPDVAARLAWVWEQAGRPISRRHAAHRALLDALDRAPGGPEPAAPDPPASAELAGFGALMRARFGTPNEAYLLFQCGRNTASLHRDQGQLVFYAFGTPILLDPGGPAGRAATWAHNTVRVDGRAHNAPGRLLEFISHSDGDYALGEIRVEALSRLTEAPGQTAAAAADLMPTPDVLDQPVVLRRHVLFDKTRQYIVVLDRIEGDQPTDVFFNVLADDARADASTATFTGPFGVDLHVFAFGTQPPAMEVFRAGPQHWTLRLSQAPPAAAEDDTEPAPPVVDYLTVLCPVRRAPEGFEPPVVEKLEGIPGVRIALGDTVRHIFLARRETTYDRGGVFFRGTRGMVTVRAARADITLFDAGEIRYRGRGVAVDHGRARFRIAPDGVVDGEVSGAREKRLTFFGLGHPPRGLSFQVDGQEFTGTGGRNEARYGVDGGRHLIRIRPE